MKVQPRHRVTSLVLYGAFLSAVQILIVDPSSFLDKSALWLYNGFASLLLGSRLLNPHFTPPADAATNGFVALSSLVVGLTVITSTPEIILLWAVIAFCACILFLSIVVLLVREETGLETRLWVRAVDRAVRGLGSPTFIFTIVILTAVWLFNRDRPVEVFAIVAAWTAVVALTPVEAVLSFWSWLREQPNQGTSDCLVGEIAAHQSPGIVLIRQLGLESVARGTPLLVADNNGPWMLGVALNYVGRDEGNLLRVLTARLPTGLKQQVSGFEAPQAAGVAIALDAPAKELTEVPAVQWIDRLCGVVDSDTNLNFLEFEVIEDRNLSEGRLVQSRIGRHWTMFQIIEGLTREEIVQQKNKYGYARARARKIGRWDEQQQTFMPVPWLPRINAPVFLIEAREYIPTAGSIGHFPGTAHGVSIDITQAVTHNSAILGILGIGKSYVAIELVERMVAQGIKVICLDLTNQYAQLLSAFIDPAYEQARRDELAASGQGRRARRNREEGGSHKAFYAKVIEQLREFISPEVERYLRIYNPAQFEVTRQASGMFDGQADMASLTPCEITAIISDAALTACQERGMTDEARVCLVYEEAHSLVPEWNSVAADGDKAATARSARAILQGRKYGLGCLLVTQRTANVTKTILNQCNTIFAMRTFDDTGKEFLANYIGGDYARILPSLEARHAVVFGKACSCENPVLVRLNDRDAFLNVFRQERPLRQLPELEERAPDGPEAAAAPAA